jgi:hypothetical protein
MVPDPPVSIDLTSSTVAPAVLGSGSTPTSANGIFNRVSATFYGTLSSAPGFYWVTGGTSYWAAKDATDGTLRWHSPDVGSGVSEPDPVSPDLVAAEDWTADNGSTGTFVVTRSAPIPVSLDLDSASSAVAATLSTTLTGNHNDLVFTSRLSGRLGNDVTVRYVSPGTNNAALAVVVSGRDITVNLATNGSAVITSTAALVKAAVEASAAAAALVTVAHKAGNDGTGVVTALSLTALSGGTGGLPLPPVSISL